MDVATIELDADAYALLHEAVQPGESVSDAIRRAVFLRRTPVTGAGLRAYIRRGGQGLSEEYLDSVEAASRHDPMPEDPWA